MLKKIDISELRNIGWIQHKKVADGYTYEEDKYTLTKRTLIELESKDNREYIHFNKPVTIITVKYHIPSNQYAIHFTLQNNTIITLSLMTLKGVILNMEFEQKTITSKKKKMTRKKLSQLYWDPNFVTNTGAEKTTFIALNLLEPVIKINGTTYKTMEPIKQISIISNPILQRNELELRSKNKTLLLMDLEDSMENTTIEYCIK